jgi:hypothetical protein
VVEGKDEVDEKREISFWEEATYIYPLVREGSFILARDEVRCTALSYKLRRKGDKIQSLSMSFRT